MFYKNRLSDLARISGIKVAVLSMGTAMFAMGCGADDTGKDKTQADIDAAVAAERAKAQSQHFADEQNKVEAVKAMMAVRLGDFGEVGDTAEAVLKALHDFNASFSTSVLTTGGINNDEFKKLVLDSNDKLKAGLGISMKGELRAFVEGLAKEAKDKKAHIHYFVAGAVLVQKVQKIFGDTKNYKRDDINSAVTAAKAVYGKGAEYHIDSGTIKIKGTETNHTCAKAKVALEKLVKEVEDARDEFESGMGIAQPADGKGDKSGKSS